MVSSENREGSVNLFFRWLEKASYKVRLKGDEEFARWGREEGRAQKNKGHGQGSRALQKGDNVLCACSAGYTDVKKKGASS